MTVSSGADKFRRNVRVPVDASQRVAVRGLLELQRAVERELFPYPVAVPVEMSAAGFGFKHRDSRQFRQGGLNTLPQPAAQQLARRIAQPGQVVQAGVVEFAVERSLHRVEQGVVNAPVACGLVLIGVKNRLEAVPVHAPALMAGRHVRQPVGRLEGVAAPDVRVSGGVQFDALMRRAAHTELLDTGRLQLTVEPARHVLVGRLRNQFVELAIVERCDPRFQLVLQLPDLTTCKRRPPGRKSAAQACLKAVAMQAICGVLCWQRVDVARRFETSRRGERDLDAHGHAGGSALEKRDRAAACRARVLAPKAQARARMRARSLNGAPSQAGAGVNLRSFDLGVARLQINR